LVRHTKNLIQLGHYCRFYFFIHVPDPNYC
jgi:hypothetical protein